MGLERALERPCVSPSSSSHWRFFHELLSMPNCSTSKRSLPFVWTRTWSVPVYIFPNVPPLISFGIAYAAGILHGLVDLSYKVVI